MMWVELLVCGLASVCHRARRTLLATGLVGFGLILEPFTFIVIAGCVLALGAAPKIHLDWLR